MTKEACREKRRDQGSDGERERARETQRKRDNEMRGKEKKVPVFTITWGWPELSKHMSAQKLL